jgi:hypothetical protein
MASRSGRLWLSPPGRKAKIGPIARNDGSEFARPLKPVQALALLHQQTSRNRYENKVGRFAFDEMHIISAAVA